MSDVNLIRIFYTLCGLGLVGCLYVLYLIVSGFLATKSAPRKPMLWCDKHGPVLEEYMIDFMGVKYCSICFHEKMRAAEQAGDRK